MNFAVTDADRGFCELVRFVKDNIGKTMLEEGSRNGKVWKFADPVLVSYLRPEYRVLQNPNRDCNPFFHVYEAMWMLAGRNDVASLKTYVKTIDQFSDDGVTFNGAYGYRWRRSRDCSTPCGYASGSTIDQLELLINHLKKTPNSRRAVLQMWNVEDDLLKIDSTKDNCCNTEVMFSIRAEGKPLDPTHGGVWTNYLDMTVINRSNDMIWGMFGANLVHFSFLQQYMAESLGIEAGIYHQFTNNLHVYEWNWKPDEWLAYDPDAAAGPMPAIKLFADGGREQFDREVKLFTEHTRRIPYNSPFLDKVAVPMMLAHQEYREHRYDTAVSFANSVAQEDWRAASLGWLIRRIEKRKATNG